jgi:hypothetical protein
MLVKNRSCSVTAPSAPMATIGSTHGVKASQRRFPSSV